MLNSATYGGAGDVHEDGEPVDGDSDQIDRPVVVRVQLKTEGQRHALGSPQGFEEESRFRRRTHTFNRFRAKIIFAVV